jgi:precorrin-6Y C5,15-methyltransferase (decarboxylating)
MQRLVVVGIGADGWPGLAGPGREALSAAEVVFGSERQLSLLPAELPAERVRWPAPLLPGLADTLRSHAGRRRVALASGDPTFHGIATSIARLLPEEELEVLPHPSSVALACAELGWPQQDLEVLSLLARPVALLHPSVQPGRRVLVLADGAHSPAEVAALLRARGFGRSRLVALSRLGAKDEQRVDGTADAWPEVGWPAGSTADPLTVLAVECRADPDAVVLPRIPGLPDAAYQHDGQLTKRHVRAVTLSALAPAPGELLWDVGGGAGSIGIEWMRSHPACRAVTIERDPGRSARISANATALGVPDLRVVTGRAPDALDGLPAPDAVFIGGGLTGVSPGGTELIERCWAALRPGGRLVANAATLESEQLLASAFARYGGELTRIEIARATPIGRFTGWRPAMPVTQWAAVRP